MGDIFTVHPERFGIGPVTLIAGLKIEDGIGAVDAAKIERFSHLCTREDLLIITRRPAEQSEEIDECFRNKTSLLIKPHCDNIAMHAFGEFRTFAVQDQRKMCKCRNSAAKSLIDKDLLGSIGDAILAAH